MMQDQTTTVGVFFEIMTSKKQESAGLADGASGQTFYLQFITKYLNGQTGRTHCRVTTVTRQYAYTKHVTTMTVFPFCLAALAICLAYNVS